MEIITMRKFQIVLLIIGLTVLSTQTFRHVYVKWFQQKTSVLEQFDESYEKKIKESKNIDELLSLYKIKLKESKEKNKVKSKTNSRLIRNSYNSDLSVIKRAIRDWERKDNAIKQLRFYWTCGLLSVIIGLLVYIKIDRWIGITGLIVGFSEMIYWTFPIVFGFFGSKHEFTRLLNNKLLFSSLSWLLLIVLWFFLYKVEGKQRVKKLN